MTEEKKTADTGENQDNGPETLPEISFDELPEELKEACGRAGWDDIMPVQKKALPYVMQGRDVMVQARTGSGKTGAFVLPLLDKLNADSKDCQALVLVPTRELAKQVAGEAEMLAGARGINVVSVYGGVGYKSQLEAFSEGAQLVVGTPGRVLDHLKNGALNFDKLKVLIFDEADRMLSIGFYPDMKRIQAFLPKRLFGAFMFSATYPPVVLRLADQFLHKPDFLSLSGDQVNVAEIENVFCEVPAMGKERYLLRLIETENPTSAIVFCNTKRNVEFVAAVIKQFGFDAEPLTADLSQNKRESVLNRIRSGQLRILVATDVAARGIDIPELSHVFMFEPPEDPESYIHRAGRTGRAGASGTVITLVDLVQKAELKRIAAKFKLNLIERKAPEDEDVAAIIEERVVALLEKKRRDLTYFHGERISRFLDMAKRFGEEEDTLVLMAMLMDEFYQSSLHSPPELPEEKGAKPKPQGGEKKGGSGGSGGGKPSGKPSGNPKRKRRPRRRKPKDD
ncbi:DEAD/DEAH box helicase [Salidesulfovibrio brasiliensis]|uniref:DEAD/DEAH box helicase n=1 Tax=Salidesulfovibrio brasiliensis TaxID=221711 RepID=UPI0006CF5123|nr:DEAD/DEAH box helicase [Salidesulfovibrio brasiliensis]